MATPLTLGQPAEIDCPDSDGQPMSDNTLQFQWIVTLQTNLDILVKDDRNVFVAGDLLWYPVQGHPEIRAAPDALVAFGRPKGYRGSYQQWQEDGIAPQVVFEVLSPGNRPDEMALKLRFYDTYGVEEYYLYDPYSGALSGWRRVGPSLQPLPGLHNEVSPRLKIRFDLSGPELVIYDPKGQKFLTPLEREAQREKAEQQARAARERTEQERLQREKAEQQARAAQEARQQQAASARRPNSSSRTSSTNANRPNSRPARRPGKPNRPGSRRRRNAPNANGPKSGHGNWRTGSANSASIPMLRLARPPKNDSNQRRPSASLLWPASDGWRWRPAPGCATAAALSEATQQGGTAAVRQVYGLVLPRRIRRFQEIVWAMFFAASFGVRCSAPLSFFCFPAAQAKEKKETSKERKKAVPSTALQRTLPPWPSVFPEAAQENHSRLARLVYGRASLTRPAVPGQRLQGVSVGVPLSGAAPRWESANWQTPPGSNTAARFSLRLRGGGGSASSAKKWQTPPAEPGPAEGGCVPPPLLALRTRGSFLLAGVIRQTAVPDVARTHRLATAASGSRRTGQHPAADAAAPPATEAAEQDSSAPCQASLSGGASSGETAQMVLLLPFILPAAAAWGILRSASLLALPPARGRINLSCPPLPPG